MKVLLWPTYYLPHIGGLEIQVHELAKALQNKGHDVLVITNTVEQHIPEPFTLDGIRVQGYPFTYALGAHKLPMIREILEHLSHRIDLFQPDILHVHGLLEFFAYYQTRLLRRFPLPLVMTLHGLLEQDTYTTSGCIELWNAAQSISCVSEGLKQSLPMHRLRHPNITTIYNGVPCPATRPLPPNPHAQHIVMIGRMSPEKKFESGLHAFHALCSTFPSITMTIVGGGPLLKKLMALSETLKLGQRVTFTNYVAPGAIRAYIDASSLILIPSVYESFCLVALQAAQRERPVVAHDIFGLNEVVEQRVSGLLLHEKTPHALSRGMSTLLENPRSATIMGKQAGIRARTHFSVQKMVNAYTTLYEEAKERHAHQSPSQRHYSNV